MLAENEIKIVSRNCANNTMNPSLYGGCIDGVSIQGIDIMFHQEVPVETFTKFTNPKFCIEKKDDYIYFITNSTNNTNNGEKCGIFARNVGMASTSRNTIRKPKPESHCTVLVWNSTKFKYLYTVTPTYMKTSLTHGQSEIGIRSTLWIVVEHIKTKKTFILISVHANAGNPTKRSAFIGSIFQDADDYERSGLYPIICGDFNEKPEVLNSYLKTNLQSSWKLGTTDVTHVNVKTQFMGYIDYVFSSKNLIKSDVLISGIDQSKKDMSIKMKKSENDHAVISQKFYL